MATQEVPPTGLTHLNSGKVREMYDFGDHLVFVTTDRISAFDHILAERIPNKGRALSAMTSFWFDQVADLVPNHRVDPAEVELPKEFDHPYFAGRTEVVKRAEMLELECIVRANLTGSALKEYVMFGTVHGTPVAPGMQAAEAFPEFMYTPSTKAPQGEHDVNISFEDSVNLVGRELAEKARDISLQIFSLLHARGAEQGIIVADTKIELGLFDGKILGVCDEVGTSDSSRFWPADQWRLGIDPPSFDKQYVRDYLEDTGWDKKSVPPPKLTNEVVTNTALKYQEGYERITGLKLKDWPGVHVDIAA